MNLFEYTPIDLQQGPAFRLIRLHKDDGGILKCELFESPLPANNCPYEALSYTWGKAERVEQIEVNSKILWITENLYSAMHYLRFPDKDRVLWVDGVCINQNNIAERGHQVQLMKNTFSQSSRVIFWSGKPTYAISIFMTAMQQLQAEGEKNRCTEWTIDDSRWAPLWSSIDSSSERRQLQTTGLQTILSRPWFKRVWIIQEVANAAAAIVCCGTYAISADVFALAPSLLGLDVRPHCRSIIDIMPNLSRESHRSWWNGDRDLLTVFRRFQKCRASDERDMIFALLGVSSDGHNVPSLLPDYSKSPEIVFYNAMRYVMDCRGAELHEVLNLMKSMTSMRTSYIVWHEERDDEIPEQLDLRLQFGAIKKQGDAPHGVGCDPMDVRFSRNASSLVIEKPNNKVGHSMDTCFAQAFNVLMKSGMEIVTSDDNKSSFARTSGGWMDDGISVTTWGKFGGNVLLVVFDGPSQVLETAFQHGYDLISKLVIDVYFPVGVESLGFNEYLWSSYRTILYILEESCAKTLGHLLSIATFSYSKGDREKCSSLFLAIWAGKLTDVEHLIHEGVDINACAQWKDDEHTLSSIFLASYMDLPEILQLLINSGGDANAPGLLYGNALSAASHYGYRNIVKILLQAGADVNASGEEYGTALQAASRGPSYWIGRFHSNREGGKPSDKYARENRLLVLNTLLQNGADVNARAGYLGRSPLIQAVYARNEDAVRLLLWKGANVNALGHYGESALGVVSWYCQTDPTMVQLLIRSGADMNPKSWKAPLIEVLRMDEQLTNIEMLLENGADVHASVGSFGYSALHAAVKSERGIGAGVRILLEHGADANKMDAYGRTALNIALDRLLVACAGDSRPWWAGKLRYAIRILRSNGAVIWKEPWMCSPQLLQSADDSRWLQATSSFTPSGKLG